MRQPWVATCAHALEKQSGAAKIFPQQVICLLTGAFRLRDAENADRDRRGHTYE
jgi:hypothetical protein